MNAVGERLLRGDIVFMMHDLNAKLGVNDALFGHVIKKHGTDDCNHNGEWFVDFGGFHSLVVGIEIAIKLGGLQLIDTV